MSVSKTWLSVLVVVGCLGIYGCKGQLSGADDPRININPEEVPETKRVRRLTADQFFKSLEVATGKRWDNEDEFAATLGRPDFQTVTSEGREMSVGFAKLAGDAARQTCRSAIEQDLGEGVTAGERVILRHLSAVEPLDPFDSGTGENLRYLALRFHALQVLDETDVRLQPWFDILQSGHTAADEARFDESTERWIAVCVGMALHPDFLTY